MNRKENEYESLPEEIKQRFADWIKEHVQPAKRANHSQSSYGIKHLFSEMADYYVTNDQSKMAMLKAGYAPVIPKR